jgi:hypothetical protein
MITDVSRWTDDWYSFFSIRLFACIFGEKICSAAIWIGRSAGIGLAIIGIMTTLGLITIPSDMIM